MQTTPAASWNIVVGVGIGGDVVGVDIDMIVWSRLLKRREVIGLLVVRGR